MRILVVDDSRAMRMMLQRAVRQVGRYADAEFVEAGDGAEALGLVEGVDVVFSDWNMPNMTGIELLRALRGAGNDVPFGFVTSETTVEATAEAFDAGACFHCTKPFDPESLEVALEWATGRTGGLPPALPANVRLGEAP